MKVATRTLLEEQIAAVVVPGRGEKNNAMLHTNRGRGASVFACSDLTNQLQCYWVDPACAWKKH